MIKSLLLGCCFAPFLFSAQSPEWKYEASFGIGLADYSEDGSLFPVKSDWSAIAGHLTLEGQGRMGSVYPFIKLRFVRSETDTETWKENGVMVQENDLNLSSAELIVGIKFPLQREWGTLTPSLGLAGGLQSHEREDFVRFEGGVPLFGTSRKVNEDVQTLGLGGGVEVEFPLGEFWKYGAEASAYWLFYTHAENDGIDAEIDGDDGARWDSSLWVAKQLKNPGQLLGLRMLLDLQWTNGGETESRGSFVEWPESESQYYSLAFFWRGEF